MGYLFIREDNGAVVEVDFPTMLAQDRAGYITLRDGVQARRSLHLETLRDGKRTRLPRKANATPPKIISDSLGFGRDCLEEMERDRVANGFSGVSFVPDPQVPEFYQAHCSSRRDFLRYSKHRGYVVKNGIGGVRLSQEELDRAAELVSRGK